MTSMISQAVESVKDKVSAVKEAVETKTAQTLEHKEDIPTTIQAVVLDGPQKVSIRTKPMPSFYVPGKGDGDMQHGVIVKIIAAGICGSDLHTYTGRTSGKSGMTLGHENLGQVVQVGSHVKHIAQGQIVVVPFNISCGGCGHCKQALTQACESKVNNPLRTGGIYGYPMSGDWEGGQAQYLLVPWADINCFQLDPTAVRGKLASFTLMSDVLPTALNAVVNAEVTVGKTVYIAGAGPIGLTCAHFSLLKGAACVIVADVNATRLKQAQGMGCFTVDVGKTKIENLNQELSNFLHGTQFVDCAIDAVGFESSAQGHGHIHESHVKSDRTAAINSCIMALCPAGHLSIPGVYLPGDSQEKSLGPLQFDLTSVFMKGITIKTGQTPCAPYLPYLYKSILYGRTDVTRFLNIRVITLNDVPKAYEQFQKGENVKYIVDPNGLFEKYNGGTVEAVTKETTGLGTALF